MPNLTMGHPIVASLRKHTSAFLDVHLMVTDPKFWVNVSCGGVQLGPRQAEAGSMGCQWCMQLGAARRYLGLRCTPSQ